MRDYYGKPICCPMDSVIRIIQLRAWLDLGESQDYEDLRLYLITGKSNALTKAQMDFASALRAKIETVYKSPFHGYGRRRSYCAAGLVTDSADYRRVFYPRNYDERFGGFGSGRAKRVQTPEWRAARKRWERSVEPFLSEYGSTKEKAG